MPWQGHSMRVWTPAKGPIGRRESRARASRSEVVGGNPARPAGGRRPSRPRGLKSSFQGLRTRAAGALAGAASTFWGVAAMAQDKYGEPTDKAIHLQPGVTPLREHAIWFHDIVLLRS